MEAIFRSAELIEQHEWVSSIIFKAMRERSVEFEDVREALSINGMIGSKLVVASNPREGLKQAINSLPEQDIFLNEP